jgi:two-component system chemotaxis response regulator CheY
MAKILIVDDSRMSRRIVREILQPAGHDVTEAGDGLSAIEQYALERPDLVILDLNMIGMYGLDVLTQLRALDADARVIVGSADIQTPTRVLVEEAGAQGFVTKPFVPAVLLLAVAAALEDRG